MGRCERCLVVGEGVALELALGDGALLGVDTLALLDLERGEAAVRRPGRRGRAGLGPGRAAAAASGPGHGILFRHGGAGLEADAHMDAFRDGLPLDAHVALAGGVPAGDAVLCLEAAGTVSLGERRWRLSPGHALALLDRGERPCRACALGRAEGVPLGLLLDGAGGTVCRGGARWALPPVEGRAPRAGLWTFSGGGGRVELVFRPVLALGARSFGYFTGRCAPAGAPALQVRALPGFAARR